MDLFRLFTAIHIEVKLDTDEWTAMKYSMYETIEIFRSTRGLRANVAVKILMAGIMAIKLNSALHILILQR